MADGGAPFILSSCGLNTAPGHTANAHYIAGPTQTAATDWTGWEGWLIYDNGTSWEPFGVPARGMTFIDLGPTNPCNMVSDGTILHGMETPLFDWTSGRITYGQMFAVNDTTACTPLGSAAIQYVPFKVPKQVDVTALYVNVTTNLAAKSCRFGIYSDVSNAPSALLYGSGDVSYATTGTKTSSLSTLLRLYPGRRYHLAFRSEENTTGRFTGAQLVATSTQMGVATGGTFGNAVYARTEAGIYGALPSTASPGGFNATALPLVGLEIA